MPLTYQYRLYPTEIQSQVLDRILYLHRRLYNQALEERKNSYEQLGKTVNYLRQANQIKQSRQNDPDVAWLNHTSIQQTLRRLQKAFDAFFRRVKAGEKPG